MEDTAVRSLACATILQAVKDFAHGTAAQKNAVLKDLRSKWMDFFSDGTSVMVADQLEANPKEIIARVLAQVE